MREFFRKIWGNKILVLSVCVIAICVLFLIARKIIDNYEFELYNLGSSDILENYDASEDDYSVFEERT